MSSCCCSCKGKKGSEPLKGKGDGFGVKQGMCGCGLKALKKTVGLEDDDIVYTSLKSEVVIIHVHM